MHYPFCIVTAMPPSLPANHREEDAATLRGLLSAVELHLRLVEAVASPSESADHASRSLERPIRSVHSSDLADPTPFLTEDVILLTTGSQFPQASAPASYVRRLRDRGVIALGFGTGLGHDAIPRELAIACADHGVPLFEVPYEVPFLAISRAVADAVAARRYARRNWALDAQKAISLAALRPDGLGATLEELSRQLNARVALFDAGGTMTRSHPPEASIDLQHGELHERIATVLRRGAYAASSFAIDGEAVLVHTLGSAGRLRGALIIIGADLDEESRGLVTSVIAMAGLALEQNEGLNRARRALRAGLLRILLDASPSLARTTARELWGDFPVAPLLVAAATVPESLRASVAEWLELSSEAAPGQLFFAPDDQGLVLIVPEENRRFVHDVAHRFQIRIGLSRPSSDMSFSAAYESARAMRARARAAVEDAASLRPGDILSAMTPGGAAVAAAVLAPLEEHDRVAGTELMHTLYTYLAENGASERAAQQLRVHRHTIRARVAHIEAILDVDLTSFPARSELWTALQLRH